MYFKSSKMAARLAIGVSFLVLAGSANAQEWYNTTQQAAPTAQIAAPAAAPAQETSDWSYTVGAGVGYAPSYEGSDEFDVIPVPVLGAEYKDGLFFADVRDGVGSYPVQGENYKLGASVGYAGGRDQDDDRKNLTGMGDVDASATANLLGEYTFGIAQVSGKVSTALSGDYGTTAELSLGSRYPVSEQVILSGSVGTVWADDEHMSNRFGVTSAQSANSGYGQYDAQSGFKSVGVSVGATYRLTEKWNVNLMASADQLVGDAADSPIVKEEVVPSVFLTTSYKF